MRFLVKLTILRPKDHPRGYDMFDLIGTRHFPTYGEPIMKSVKDWVKVELQGAHLDNLDLLVEAYCDEPTYHNNTRVFTLHMDKWNDGELAKLDALAQEAIADIKLGERW